ncbi:hypothetical protein CHS0354_023981 [Potamilus streckersoni]|uniref:Cytochrome c domain-containing protein n=1 Tax=Potamilus streckersoni TaxID=2493646 RepID=A0AAE0VMS4_9BIVA|nr:hypothetical protein CHS0354_023981 [Potamilus streckersoni]
MRLPVSGTVSRGDLREDVAYYVGKEKDGSFVKQSPVEVSRNVLYRGKERYNIYCSSCHGGVGDGKGVILNYGLIPPTFHSDRLRSIEDGYIYDVITNGIRTMPSYRHSVPVQDRWAIILYVRALQRSQNARVQDIPDDVKRSWWASLAFLNLSSQYIRKHGDLEKIITVEHFHDMGRRSEVFW